MSGVSDVSTDDTFSNFSASAELGPSIGTASSSHAFTKICKTAVLAHRSKQRRVASRLP